MKKLLIYFLLLLPLAIASCGGDDEPTINNQPEQPEQPSTEFEVHDFKRSDGYAVFHRFGKDDYQTVSIIELAYHGEPYISFGSRGYYDSHGVSCRVVNVGKHTKLSDIKQVPTDGWSTPGGSMIYKIELNDAFIAEVYNGENFFYYRFLITEYIKSASGDIVDIKGQFQQFRP